MKILQLVTKRQYRGAEVFAANLSEELLKLNHQIYFVGLYRNNNEILKVEGAQNIDLIENKSRFSLPLIKKLILLVKEIKPDIIQCNGSDTLKYMISASLFLPDIPILYRNISMISEWVDRGPKKRLYRNLFKKVAHVTSVGEEAINDFITTFDYPRDQTTVIRRGIPLKNINKINARNTLREELQLGDEDKIAMHIGNFSLEKNHLFLIEIFSELQVKHPQIKLVCVGTGVLFEEIKAKVVEKQLENTIYFLGFRKDIPELLAGADFFVLASKVEGVPGVILEAATQRLPSISTNVGGVKEVLKNMQTGFIIQDFDKQEIIKKIIQLADDDDLRAQLGDNAYDFVVQHFNTVNNAQKFEELYNGIIGSNKKGLRVLQLIQKKQYRGAEIFACQLSGHLVDQGHEVEIYSIYEGEATLPFEGEVRSLDRTIDKRYYDLQGWKDLARIIKKFKPDVIQANAADTLKYAIFSRLIFKWGTPIIFRNASASSFFIKNEFSKKLNAFLLKRTEYIISVSEASKKDLNKMFPFTLDKSTVIPVGIEKNKSFEEIRKFSNSKKHILHVGSFTAEKNHAGLFEIFKIIHDKNPETVLHLIGDGPLRRKIEKLILKFNLKESVVLHGELNDPFPFIHKFDVLVLPSLIEGLPAVLLEAMYYKTPVVAYKVGGVDEIITPETGYAVEEGDSKSFINSVISALEHSEMNETMVERAYKMVIENYLNEDLAEKFIECYKTISLESAEGK